MSETRASSKDFADPVKSRAEKRRKPSYSFWPFRQHSRSLSPGETGLCALLSASRRFGRADPDSSRVV